MLNIDIKEFHDPLNTKGKAKTLNGDYLKLVFKSPKFKSDFTSYINSEAIKLDYNATLKRKIRHLLLKFDHYFGTEKISSAKIGIEKAQNYFRKNRQCKLPWTRVEIDTAVNTFTFMAKTL